ncbi:hypothetical protein ACIBG4_05310 [Nonomuraea sp. NPDC050383]|uniref:hypothetical protein n=1 Tax=Nonomuraea sp. NPDC050383 TaxID=3364362 RepID=UPI00379BB0FA
MAGPRARQPRWRGARTAGRREGHTMRRVTIVRPTRPRPDPNADLDLRSPSGRRLPY